MKLLTRTTLTKRQHQAMYGLLHKPEVWGDPEKLPRTLRKTFYALFDKGLISATNGKFVFTTHGRAVAESLRPDRIEVR